MYMNSYAECVFLFLEDFTALADAEKTRGNEVGATPNCGGGDGRSTVINTIIGVIPNLLSQV